ncbi:hypothetical protein [Bifidobacterium myosotis]|uniref:DNA-binding protein n=1 Tax=Bifidobacterium myosotis TaxID=1630166 RepID=A0A5M9ZH86_9BIFI|nr:hypothetical protein [Bifidobacterium myosotis]KAA8826981.1 hypothetical protein EMO91_10645 [Bifidobacterium myosotis]
MGLLDDIGRRLGLRPKGIGLDEACARLGMTRHLVRKAVRLGDLHPVSDNPMLFDPAEVDAYGEAIRRQREAVTEAIRAMEREEALHGGTD